MSTGVDPNLVTIGIVLGILFLGIVLWTSSTVSVPAGSRGVLLTWGKATDTLAEGLSFKMPFITNVAIVSVQTQKYEVDAAAASKDLQDVSTKVVLNYHINADRVLEFYRDLGSGYSDKVIQPAVQEAVKASTAHFAASELITDRATVKNQIDINLVDRLAPYGITVETISITDFQFSDSFWTAIEAKVTAEQNALKAENDLRRIEVEARQTVATAQGQADSKLAIATANAKATLVNAEADANATVLNARADAEAIRLKNEQLNQSASYLTYQAIQRWDGAYPLIMSGGNGGSGLLIDLRSMLGEVTTDAIK